MKYCRSCLATDLRPNASFNTDGICIACEYSLAKSIKNDVGDVKLRALKRWLKELKSRNGRKQFHEKYDCIVGVSGGKDSTRQAHWVRDRLGMTPLLVCGAYPPKQMTEIGGQNLSNLISMGFDLEVVCPAPKTAAHLSLLSFRQFGNVCKSTEMGLFSVVPRIAIEKKIPFIFWGENPALQVGDSKTLGENEFDGNNLRNLNTLVEGGSAWMSSLTRDQNLSYYHYPDFSQMQKLGVNIVYLGPAWDDWSNDENSAYAALQGLELRPYDVDTTGDISGASMLDEEFTNINMMIKYYKFGFGRATDTVNEKIRAGLITREKGIEIVDKYDGVCSDAIIERYCNYVNINEHEFWDIVHGFTNKKLFTIQKGQRPLKKFSVGHDYD